MAILISGVGPQTSTTCWPWAGILHRWQPLRAAVFPERPIRRIDTSAPSPGPHTGARGSAPAHLQQLRDLPHHAVVAQVGQVLFDEATDQHVLAAANLSLGVHRSLKHPPCRGRSESPGGPEVPASASMSVHRSPRCVASPTPGPLAGRILSLRPSVNPSVELMVGGWAGLTRSIAQARAHEPTLAAAGGVRI